MNLMPTGPFQESVVSLFVMKDDMYKLFTTNRVKKNYSGLGTKSKDRLHAEALSNKQAN